ncbi:CoxG family protein, partial [Bordetella petrii]|uniref:CoxG family protein n=1 Tax=Bordetella petrii TaxID=94624 RepID=UPI001E2F3E8A
MLIEGTKILAADRGTVWNALNDPAFLQATLPDCKSLSADGDDSYTAVMVSAIGPVKATFQIAFRREVETPMQAYALVGQGDAGVAGSAQGRMRIALADIDGGTQLSYSAETTINGRIAQLGSRLIDSAARKFSERFFQNVQRRLAPHEAAETGVARTAAEASAP